jgi:Fe-S oxidoreductase
MNDQQILAKTIFGEKTICWIAYCITCKKVIDQCPNGDFVEAAGRRHVYKNSQHGHEIIIGHHLIMPTF